MSRPDPATAELRALLPGFAHRWAEGPDGPVPCSIGGSGPPLLLLHGHPQTRAMWHPIAAELAGAFTVVATDLRGYGDAPKPPSSADHAAYAKRAMAAEQVAVMAALGFDRFTVVAHDRGARTAHRMCLDHPERVARVTLMDIAPTLTMYEGATRAFAQAYWHWFFLIQPAPLPERLLTADPDAYLDALLGRLGGGLAGFDPRALAEYRRCFHEPETIRATCEDYRAAATIDLEHDRADAAARIACPVQVLWGSRGVIGRLFDPIGDWSAKASAPVTGSAIAAGHFLVEENPAETLAALRTFLQF